MPHTALCRRAACLVPACLVPGVLAASALAGSPDSLFDWATITHAGNRATNAAETPMRPDANMGAVGYEYRMATTEVTVGNWLDFVIAYEPFYEYAGPFANPDFTGTSIVAVSGQIYIRDGRSPNRAADMSWEYAARYCNWLHNGMVNERWAFESGAYDTSTFTFNDDGSSNHQLSRSEGARYWMPSRDEWVKAAHYDPNRYGEGRGGYWLFPNGTNEQSIGNLLPENGGERNAGDWTQGVFPLDVGSFPGVQSPFGLMDLSGGVCEWMETTTLHGGRRSRIAGGTYYASYDLGNPFTYDRIEFDTSGYVNLGGPAIGLRLASSVPAPGSIVLVLGTFGFYPRRSR